MLRTFPLRCQTMRCELSLICSLFACSTVLYLKTTLTSDSLSESFELNGFLDRRILTHKIPPDIRGTDLHLFDDDGLVELFDRLVIKKQSENTKEDLLQPEYFELEGYNETKRVPTKRTLHLSFVGDSRIRQLFAMMYQVIPDYDLGVYPEQAKFSGTLFIPRQMILYSELLSSIVSFYWFNLLVERRGLDVFKFLHNWLGHRSDDASYKLENNTLIVTPLPDVLVIGIGPHHMLKDYPDAHEDVFFTKLHELVPVLQNVSKYCQVIWLNQYPTNEFFGENKAHNTDVHSQKLWHYNRVVNKILRDGGIPVWSSGSPIAEEYFRSCLFNKRMDGYTRNYFHCADYIHPGLSAMSDIMQIFYNLVSPTQNFVASK